MNAVGSAALRARSRSVQTGAVIPAEPTAARSRREGEQGQRSADERECQAPRKSQVNGHDSAFVADGVHGQNVDSPLGVISFLQSPFEKWGEQQPERSLLQGGMHHLWFFFCDSRCHV